MSRTFFSLRIISIYLLREFAVPIDSSEPNWDSEWRLFLVDRLEVLVRQLWEVGLDEIYINGSFVEKKPHPNDIDGYFNCKLERLATGDLSTELNKLDPYKIWTWDPNSRRPYRGYAKKQLPMWHRYRVELYPNYGQSFGALDEHGHQLLFPSAFRRTRYSEEPKGIIRIIK